MKPEELQAIMKFLMNKVSLNHQKDENEITINFNAPTENEMIEAGLNPEGIKRILNVTWWDEMVEDIEDTPDMCDPDDQPEQVLQFAKDVVSEYIRKWFPLNEE